MADEISWEYKVEFIEDLLRVYKCTCRPEWPDITCARCIRVATLEELKRGYLTPDALRDKLEDAWDDGQNEIDEITGGSLSDNPFREPPPERRPEPMMECPGCRRRMRRSTVEDFRGHPCLGRNHEDYCSKLVSDYVPVADATP